MIGAVTAERSKQDRRLLRIPGTDGVIGWILCAPAAILLGLFMIVPLVAVSVLAFFGWDPLTQTDHAVGFANFSRILTSPDFRSAVLRTLEYTVLTVPVTLLLGLVIAVAVNNVRHGAMVWRTVFFLPVASTLAATSVAWRFMFYPHTGIIDQTIGRVLPVQGWLQSTDLAIVAVSIVGIWQALGTTIVIFLAGLSGVPRHLHDAAALDGATAWSRFWHVTWPALGPATVLALVIDTRDSLRVFDQVQVMTEGGPLGSTTTLSYLLWQRGIHYNDLGGGAVIDLVILLVVFAFIGIQLRTAGRRLNDGATR
ncbi:carbohydrate ABC transporter permease [Amycolatopsis sp. GM8]|uniref:carbohydrate ABC transporter permease n=1 Tax=Amycolatopsis sp. GM8 TaxID=2896530 RepID=UPI001F3EA683|nr:sugar ABC transporter permease [Amycolatopsis sp. GM8]